MRSALTDINRVLKMNNLAGQRVLHYRIIEQIGQGGMGVVYKAEDTKLKREVAIKFLPHYISANNEERKRFEVEAQAAASLNHPGISHIYAVEETADEMFIVMECVNGETIGRKISNSPLKVEEAISYAIQIAETLQDAHSNGIIHRDIKSENIMVDSKNRIKVMDFGLAKFKDSVRLTDSGSTTGTIAYMAPEQIRGESTDSRSDIFSFGVVFFEMLTGVLPFRGKHNASMMYSILNEEPKPLQKYLPEAGLALIYIVNRVLEKNPEKRYQSMNEVTADLQKIKLNGISSSEMPAEKGILQREINRSYEISGSSVKKKKFIVSALVIIILIILGYFFLLNKSSASVIEKSIAVLPFKNLSPDMNDKYLADGITEDLTATLSQIRDLKVIAKNSAEKFKNSEASLKEIGSKLGAAALLEGSFQKVENEVRVTAQLVDVKTGEYLWTGIYDKEINQIFTIQSDVSEQIANVLKAKLTPSEELRINKKQTENITAYQYYLKGKDYYFRYHKEDNENAIKLFKQALKLDSNYALAYAGLGDCYMNKHWYDFPGNNWIDSSISEGNKAISLDSNLIEGYKTLSTAVGFKGWGNLAKEVMEKGLKKNPNYNAVAVQLGDYYSYTNDFATANYWYKKVIQLNPLLAYGYANLAWDYIYLEDYKKAEKNLNDALSLEPDNLMSYQNYWLMHRKQGRYDLAIKDCEKMLTISPDLPEGMQFLAISYYETKNYDKVLELFNKYPFKKGAFLYKAYIYKLKGNIDSSKYYLEAADKNWHAAWYVRNNKGNGIAKLMFLVKILEGDKKEAYIWLDRAVKAGFIDYNSLLVDPITESVRDEKQFKNAIQIMKDKIKEQQKIVASIDKDN